MTDDSSLLWLAVLISYVGEGKAVQFGKLLAQYVHPGFPTFPGYGHPGISKLQVMADGRYEPFEGPGIGEANQKNRPVFIASPGVRSQNVSAVLEPAHLLKTA